MSDERLGDLYRTHGADALRLAYVLTRDEAAAEDITQEAFVRIGRKLFGLRDLEHEKAYIFRTVINLSRSRGRKLGRERAALARLEPPASRPAPEVDDTWGQLTTLPARQRAALFFRYYLDHSEEQVAELLECSPSAAKSLIHRGLRALREEGRWTS